MLSLLKISNVALIDDLEVEFGPGLNLLTGETGSGKSIIVDSLAALTGERVSAEIVKEGRETARIEGLFSDCIAGELAAALGDAGIDASDGGDADLIIRREISPAGRNRVFLNNQLVTASLLRRISPFLVDIHGQGEQASLFDPASHREMLDRFANCGELLERTAAAFDEWKCTRAELAGLRKDEAEKLQLIDILTFQADEIRRASLDPNEAEELEAEKLRLNNAEKLTRLSSEAFSLLYENDDSTVSTLAQAAERVSELGEFDDRFREHAEGLASAAAIVEDAAIALRDLTGKIEFSPERISAIEDRLAEISRLARKYGGSVGAALEHLAEAERRLEKIETAELREKELTSQLAEKHSAYLEAAAALSRKRHDASMKFAKAVSAELRSVAFEKAVLEVRIDTAGPTENDTEGDRARHGIDRIEFLFSANPGEPPKPLEKIASGGETSRLMLILKTVSRPKRTSVTAVFDEIDAGIGGRVAEAVGLRLRELAQSQQVLCVTHQAQVASKADHHFAVEKTMGRSRTTIAVRELSETERIEELARMLAGEEITQSARENAREMLAAAAGK